MRTIINPSDTLTNKISYYHLLLFVALLPFDLFYSQMVLISFILHTIISLKKENLAVIRQKEVLLLTSVFLVAVVCTVYTDNSTEAFKLLSRQLAILIFPLVLFLNPIDLKKYSNSILRVFVFSCTLTVLYLFTDAIRILHFHQLPLSSLLSPAFTNHNFSSPIAIHATYFSLYLALCLFTSVQFFRHAKNRLTKTGYLFIILILLTGLVQLGSRAVILALLLYFCVLLPFWLWKNRKPSFIYFSLLLAAAIICALATVQPIQRRFLDQFAEDLTTKTPAYSVAAPRMKRWELAFELVKRSPFAGYGTGAEEGLLQEKYFANRLYDAYLNRLNAHNQYISFLLMGGIVALAVYLFTLVYGYRLALRSGNIVFAGFVLLVSIVSVSENILFRNKGIFFYSFFFSLFVCITCNRKQAPIPQKNKTTGNPVKQNHVCITNA